ncbi:MAG TPA: carboxypeptidase regulatory-like domain-containing protein [Kofleriaceae bacterium]|nr:carboxypeptidase regulatory-like domain-containing protein [Kofleriaceae bacterium]
MARFLVLAAMLAGCLSHTHGAVEGGALGRVVIYRNGVAFYERHATAVDGKLAVRVPRDRVDDFLKSLTVFDAHTKKPVSVTIPRKEADNASFLTMTLETAQPRADVLLTYVTEAPAWKPSYRVAIGANGKVMFEGWAIVDNVSGEDWKHVLVGVGASSALSFRYDLWSVRRIDRDLLQGDDRFAVAPPTGVSPYDQTGASEELVALDPSEVRGDAVAPPAKPAGATIAGAVTDAKTGAPLVGVTVVATSPAGTASALSDERGGYALEGLAAGTYELTYYYGNVQVAHPGVAVAAGDHVTLPQKLKAETGGEVIAVTGHAPQVDQASTAQGITIDKDYIQNVPVPSRTLDSVIATAAGSTSDENSYVVDGVNTSAISSAPPPPPPVQVGDAKLRGVVARLLAAHKDVVIESHATTPAEAATRAQAVRNKLVDDGVPAARIRVVPKVGPSESGIRLLAVAPGAPPETAPPSARPTGPDAPVGESHFVADRPMNVPAGTSAMVSMVHQETTGGVVYLYDPISDRGDARYAFKAVRLDNPTPDTLEPGPVTVYGDDRFIGEGITEPVPPHASVVVPFALDRQIVVSHDERDSDQIAKLVTVQRGIVTAELQHRRRTRFSVTSRLTTPAKVYLRHRLQSDWTLVDAPPRSLQLGDSKLFEVDVAPGETRYVDITEATPVERKLELGSGDALDLMHAYVDEPDASPALRVQLEAMLATHRDAMDLEDKLATLREQLGEYRARAGELHAQLVTLKAVKTGGDLMVALRQKLADTSEAVQKATIAIVDTEEQLMLLRVKFQNQLADLHLTDATAPIAAH